MLAVVRAASRPGGPALGERALAVPRLVRATLDGSYAGTTLGRLGLVAAAAAYVASPVDLLPESVLPVVGLADDAVVLTWAARAFVDETDRFLAWEAGQGHRPPPPSGRPGAPAGRFGRADGGRWPSSDAGDAPGAQWRGPGGLRVPGGPRVVKAAGGAALEAVRRRLER
ncbi:YkvA family protein [Terracoccus luteus]|uniref:Uncharacterized protein DUF1232 n=1 Tax=Terracoccus luteus TaxID=53356 RepID=A0A495XUF8_9MICO|nr:YkvA family protein [Terracoccus luteus]MBB2987116.1 hypothetical protein [Terracoccus luteus]MCP2172767.1 hypothetical protein [Terracoccus luteus]RKT77159.1 uncharacterized protein DUF1232 [Terracoccus luteus]